MKLPSSVCGSSKDNVSNTLLQEEFLVGSDIYQKTSIGNLVQGCINGFEQFTQLLSSQIATSSGKSHQIGKHNICIVKEVGNRLTNGRIAPNIAGVVFKDFPQNVIVLRCLAHFPSIGNEEEETGLFC